MSWDIIPCSVNQGLPALLRPGMTCLRRGPNRIRPTGLCAPGSGWNPLLLVTDGIGGSPYGPDPTQQTKRSRKPAMIQSPGSVQNEVRDTSQGTAFISAIDGGLLSLAMIAGYYRIACDPAQMAHDLGLGHRAANAEDIVRAARRLGLKARALPDQTPKRLRSAPLPSILQMRDGSFVILTHRLDDGRLRIIRPLTRAQSFETLEDVTQAWSGELVLI